MIAEKFTKLRKNKGSQFLVANILGVSQAQISIWETGYKPIPDHIAKKMENLNKQPVR